MIWKRLKKSTPDDEEKFREMMKEANPGAKDKFAMILSAFITLVIPSALVIIVISLIGLLIFGAFR